MSDVRARVGVKQNGKRWKALVIKHAIFLSLCHVLAMLSL